MTTLLQLRRLTRSRLGIPPSDSFHRDDIIDDHINLAILAIEEVHRWPWQEKRITQTTTAGSREVDMPDDWRATRSVIYDHREVLPLTPYDLERMPTNYNGVPTNFAILNRTLLIGPTPQSPYDLTHYYYKQPSVLVNDDDKPDAPDEYAGAIVSKAAELLSIREDDRAAAQSHQVEYAQWLDSMQKDLRRFTRPVGRRIRPGAWV